MDTSVNLIALSGELDLSNASALHASLGTVCGPTVVDLSVVTYLDSAALTELALLRRRVGSVALIVPSQQIRRTLEIVGFMKAFRVVESRDFL
ncbi:MAG TPA: STAS domain-containing protein [Candidatus Elarobacter sp.]|nr:STAS domain-containing protein [Dongiaceae bacterium]HZW53862.1 STAS domain-containing protein [Candidatus Elarobacter sp.]